MQIRLNLADIANYYMLYLQEGDIVKYQQLLQHQKITALHHIIRVNASELYVFKLRNYQDLECFINEVSALIDK